jgi:hypothetical protein
MFPAGVFRFFCDHNRPGREKFLLQKESVLVNFFPYDSTDLDENA